MPLEPNLKDALLAMAEGQKTHYIMIASMMTEIVALRETVRGLDTTFSEVMEHKLPWSLKRIAPKDYQRLHYSI
jgi:hypothetical protein